MKSGNHIAHIIECFNKYGFFTYQCNDQFQTKLDFIVIKRNISILGKVVEIRTKQFDLKKDLTKNDYGTLSRWSNHAQVGIIVYCTETDCYYRLPYELLERAVELDIRLIEIKSATLYSVALETWRNNVNDNL